MSRRAALANISVRVQAMGPVGWREACYIGRLIIGQDVVFESSPQTTSEAAERIVRDWMQRHPEAQS
jgi:hypothetical protein